MPRDLVPAPVGACGFARCTMDLIETEPTAAPTPQADAKDAQLRQAARDLEGVFVAELFKAMRQTVPEGGMAGGGVGEVPGDDQVAAGVLECWS